MMLQPIRQGSKSRPRVIGKSVVAPVGGWNAKDGLGSMKPNQAVILDNWFPKTSSVDLRGGFSSYATGMGTGSVESLFVWSGASQKMLAAANGGIYDVSASGAVGAALATGYTSNRWQHVNIGTAGGQFILAVNGVDTPWNYNGTAVASIPAITGVTPENLTNVELYKSRLFFTEKGTLKFWYLPVNSIGGAASSFDLSSLCRLGGYLVAIGTWTRDGGSGPDDLITFVTSMGEVVAYTGTDPSNASLWNLNGVFRTGAPIGRRCMMKMAGDLVLITQDGYVTMNQVLPVARSDNAVALSYNIQNAVSTATAAYGGNFGWQPFLYPKGNMVIFNVPTGENASAQQHVMNTITKAWTRFTNQNANCWALFNDAPYFGGNAGVVYQADSGFSDAGSNIQGDVQQAFNYFGMAGQLKQFTMVRPIIVTNGTISAALAANVDFDSSLPTTTPTFSGSSGSPWDTSPWDVSPWGDSGQVQKDWESVSGLGYCAALRMQVATNALSVSWASTDWLMMPGHYV